MRWILVLLLAVSASSCTTSTGAQVCEIATQCDDPGEPICDQVGVCRACINDVECRSAGDRGTCAPDGSCVECVADVNCASGFCDDTRGACVDCRDDDDCDGGRCAGSACVQCTSDADCSRPTPVCEGAVCVQCRQASDCEDSAPRCDASACVACRIDSDCVGRAAPTCGDDGGCVPCRVGTECESSVCDHASGNCVSEAGIIYVSAEAPMSVPACGTKGRPCGTIEEALEQAAASLDAHVLVLPGSYEILGDALVRGDEVHVTAHGATITVPESTTFGVGDAGTLVLEGGTVRYEDFGLACVSARLELRQVSLVDTEDRSAIVARSCEVRLEAVDVLGGGQLHTAGSLVARRCRFDGGDTSASWFLEDTELVLENTVVIDTMISADSAIAGPTAHVRHSTFDRSPVTCAPNQPVIFESSILWGAQPDQPLLGEDCLASFSDIEGGFAGEGNIDRFPRFADRNSGDLRLQSSSPAIDAASPTSSLGRDFERNPRPVGDGFDMGAFEYQAPGTMASRNDWPRVE